MHQGNDQSEYIVAVEQYWQNQMNYAGGRINHSRAQLLVHDIKSVIMRFARQQSFSTESHGGGTESNMNFLVFMVQMALFLTDESSAGGGAATRKSLEAELNAFISVTQEEEWAKRAATGSDDVFYMATLSLLLMNPADWASSRFVLTSLVVSHLLFFCLDVYTVCL